MSMARVIHLEIVTPDGVRLSQDVEELTAPSIQGEFGVLPEHRPLLAGLRTGLIRYRVDGEMHAVAVGPGFAKVGAGGVSILTDQFMAKEEVDPVVARKDLKEAEQELSEIPSDANEIAKAAHIAKVRWAAVRLELYGDPPPPTIMLEHEIRLLGHEDYTETVNEGDAEESSAEKSVSAQVDRVESGN